MKKSILAMLFITAHAFRMTEDAPVQATPSDENGQKDAATVTLSNIPAEHASTVERLLALLERGEQWVVDNVRAGLTTLENMFKGDEDNQ